VGTQLVAVGNGHDDESDQADQGRIDQQFAGDEELGRGQQAESDGPPAGRAVRPTTIS